MTQAAEFDVAIIGGRVAGASLALLLTRQGRRVAILDRDEFPSDTLSTHFMAPAAVAHLARLGVVADMLAAGFRPIVRHRTYVEDCLLEGPAGPAGTFSLAPRRSVLDTALVEHAVQAGATFFARTRAERLIARDGHVEGVSATSADGVQREIRATVVVGADGKNSKVAQWVGARAYHEVAAMRPLYYGYYRGLAPLPEATIELFFGGDTIGFAFPMRAGEDCLALELQPAEFETFRTDPQRHFEERFRALPDMERRFANATLEGKLRGAKGVENYFRVPYGPGWALTGDAAYLKDPSTGLGIGDALAQAFLLSDALAAFFGGADWATTMAQYQHERDELMKPIYRATISFTRLRDPQTEELDLLRAACSMPTMARRILTGLPGHLDALLSPPAVGALKSIAANWQEARTKPDALV